MQTSPSLEVREGQLLDFLRNYLHMKAETEYHDQSDTVEDWNKALHGRYVDSEQTRYKLCKNFFLHHKKKKEQKFYGVALAETNVNMNNMSKNLGLGSGNLRFADNEELPMFLDILPGSVTPLAFHILHPSILEKRPDLTQSDSPVIPNMKSLTIIVDANIMRVLDGTTIQLLFHPLHNCASTSLTQSEFKEFMKACLGEEAWGRVIVYDFEKNTKHSVMEF